MTRAKYQACNLYFDFVTETSFITWIQCNNRTKIINVSIPTSQTYLFTEHLTLNLATGFLYVSDTKAR